MATKKTTGIDAGPTRANGGLPPAQELPVLAADIALPVPAPLKPAKPRKAAAPTEPELHVKDLLAPFRVTRGKEFRLKD
ncbi:MAG: hypothetical protein ACRC7C_09040, partial [Beijerinckiaceae bacterium]